MRKLGRTRARRPDGPSVLTVTRILCEVVKDLTSHVVVVMEIKARLDDSKIRRLRRTKKEANAVLLFHVSLTWILLRFLSVRKRSKESALLVIVHCKYERVSLLFFFFVTETIEVSIFEKCSRYLYIDKGQESRIRSQLNVVQKLDR
jgi:hypothetical protein